MNKTELQFAVVISNGVVQNIGKSTIYTPVAKCKGQEIKWFDDRKLIRGGDAYKI